MLQKLLSLGIRLFGLLARPMESRTNQFHTVIQLQFLFDVGSVGIDRIDAEMEFGGDLPRFATVTDQLENLPLPMTQLLDLRTTRRRFTADKLCQNRG